MAMAWPDSPAYDSLAPQFDSPAPAPPAAKYDANVERWRPMVQKYFKPEDVDKALYVVQHESGGDPTIMNGDAAKNGPSPGLFQITAANAKAAGIDGTDPEQAVKWAATQVANHGWTDWGEGTNYKGVNFGALGGANPFGPGGTGVNDIGRITGGLVGKTIASLKPSAYSAFKPSASDATDMPAATDAPMLGVSPSDYGMDEQSTTTPLSLKAGRPVGGFRDTETQVDPNAKTSDPVNAGLRTINEIGSGLSNTLHSGYRAATAASGAISPAAVQNYLHGSTDDQYGPNDVIDPIRSLFGLQQAGAKATKNPVETYLHDQAMKGGGGQLGPDGQVRPGGTGSTVAGLLVPDNPVDQAMVLQGAKDLPAGIAAIADVGKAGANQAGLRIASSETANRFLPPGILTEERVGAGLARRAGVDPIEGARLKVGLSGAAETPEEAAAASNAPLPGQRGLFDQPAPRIEHDAAIANKFITAAEAEAKLRTSGVIDNEIRAGRAQQAQGIMGSMKSGQSLEDAGRASSEGAYQGGSLRKTFIPKIDISPEEGQKLVGSLHDQMIAGEITPFEYKQLVQPNGIVNRLTSDTPHLQPAEIRLVHRVFGGEANASLEDIAHELQQVQGLGHPKTEFPAQEWPPTAPNAAPEGLRPRATRTVVTHELDESAPLAGQPSVGQAPSIGYGPEPAPLSREQRIANELAGRGSINKGLRPYVSTEEELALNRTARANAKAAEQARVAAAQVPAPPKPPQMSQAEYDQMLNARKGPGAGGIASPISPADAFGTNQAELGRVPIGEGPNASNAFRAESAEEIAATRKAMGIRENAHKFADTSFAVGRQIVNELQGLTGASMTLKSSLSPPLFRQGLVRLVTNPAAAMREFASSLKAARSVEDFEKVNQILKDNPWTSIKVGPNEQFSPVRGYTIEDLAGAKEASKTVKGFKLREAGGGVSADARAPEFQGLNESRVSRAVERIPGIGLSDRQAATSFNANVVGRYSEVAGKRWAMEERLGLPHDQRDYSAILDTVLHQQQYGGLTQKNIPALFSTRALSGRVQALADVFVQPGSIFQPSARQEAVKGLMSVVGFNTAMIGLVSQVPGFSVKWQSGLPTLLGPGGFHIDPWAGYNAIVKLPMKIGRDLDKELGNDGWQKNANWDDALHKVAKDGVAFARNQLGPITGKLTDIGTGKDYLGKPYSLTGDVESGQFFRDMAAPFIVDDIIQSYAEDGLRGMGLTTPLSALSAGVGNYTTTGEARDTAARQIGPDANGAYPTKTGAKPGSYEDLMPEARMQVDSTDAVTKARGGPTPYQASNTADRADTVAEVSRQEQLHDQGKNTKKLSDVYHDAGVANRATAKALENQFADEFAGFDKDKYEKAVEGYYNQEKTIPEGEDDAGGHDFDATAAAQADYLAKLPPEQRAWVTQALGLSEAKKTKTQQAYDKYIADKKAAGYFDIDPKDPDGAKKRETLNRANPDLDYQAWQFNSTSGKGGKSLETIAAVNKALADPLSKNVPVKMAGLGRAVNESEGTTAAFKDTLGKSDSLGERAQKFLSGFQVERDKERIAQEVYHKSYASMTDSEQQAVANRIRRSVLASSPDLEAYLAWMGQRDTISASSTAIDTLRMLRQRYGRETGRTEKNPIKFSE